MLNLMEKIIALIIVIPIAWIFWTLMFKGGEKIADKKLKFIKNKQWRNFFGLLILIIIVYGIGGLILN